MLNMLNMISATCFLSFSEAYIQLSSEDCTGKIQLIKVKSWIWVALTGALWRPSPFTQPAIQSFQARPFLTWSFKMDLVATKKDGFRTFIFSQLSARLMGKTSSSTAPTTKAVRLWAPSPGGWQPPQSWCTYQLTTSTTNAQQGSWTNHKSWQANPLCNRQFWTCSHWESLWRECLKLKWRRRQRLSSLEANCSSMRGAKEGVRRCLTTLLHSSWRRVTVSQTLVIVWPKPQFQYSSHNLRRQATQLQYS